MINKKDFEKWITDNNPRVTKPQRYTGTLKTISNHLKEKHVENYDLYRLSDYNDAVKLRKSYFSYPEHVALNERGNNMYSRSFDLLVEYLGGNENRKKTRQQKRIVIQPIGKNNSMEDFLVYNRDRWAEKNLYKDKWKESENAIVLFTKDANVFAKARITKISEDGDSDYPLDYFYDNLTSVDNIDYKTIIELAEHPIDFFRTYTLLDEKHSIKVLRYLNSIDMYLNDTEADDTLQSEIENIDALEPAKAKPQKAKKPIEVNGRKVYPRNLSYAKKALENASYFCEIDSSHTTFISKTTGQQYVEAHHLIPLKYQDAFRYSLDVPVNIVALCPTCHRKLHHGTLEETRNILETLLLGRKELLVKFGIDVDLGNLESLYG